MICEMIMVEIREDISETYHYHQLHVTDLSHLIFLSNSD